MPYPEIGQPLRRAAEAHVLPEKWRGWILAAHGHGPEWARVFRVELTDSEMVWQAIASAVLDAPVSTVRDRGAARHCLLCAGEAVDQLPNSFGGNGLAYVDDMAAPRLVTAYPSP